MSVAKIVSAGVVLLALLVPFQTSTVPAWRIRYVDPKGNAVANLPVAQSWQNYSVESTGNSEVRKTDALGYVTFPARYIRSPALLRVVGPLSSFFRGGVHASYGPSSWLVAQCDVLDSGPTLAIFTGATLPNEVALKYFDRSGIRAAMPAGVMHLPPECVAIEAQVRAAGA